MTEEPGRRGYPTPEVPTDYPVQPAVEPVNAAELAVKLADCLADLPPAPYTSVSATWTNELGLLLTLSMSSTTPEEKNDDD